MMKKLSAAIISAGLLLAPFAGTAFGAEYLVKDVKVDTGAWAQPTVYESQMQDAAFPAPKIKVYLAKASNTAYLIKDGVIYGTGVKDADDTVSDGIATFTLNKADFATAAGVNLKVIETDAAVAPTDLTKAKPISFEVLPGTAPSPTAYNANMSVNGEDKGSTIVNANQTGTGVTTNDGSSVNQVIKSTNMINNLKGNVTQKTHGEYQNNTNSCASCHQTHTAASKSLLFKDGVYNTCTACHDGTLGFYNVFSVGDSTAGTFGGSVDASHNASMHMATGAVQMKAAPGGNMNATTGSWTAEFNCASCHAPHGSYSDRLLHYNPNGMGEQAPKNGGIKADRVPVVAFADKDKLQAVGGYADVMDASDVSKPKYKYLAVKGTAAEHGLTSEEQTTIGAASVIMVYEWKKGTPNTYVKTTNPWLYNYSYPKPAPKKYITSFSTKDANTALDYTVTNSNYEFIIDQNDSNVKFEYGKGYAYGTALDAALSADISRAFAVKLDLVATGDNIAGYPVYKVNQAALHSGTLDTNGTLKTNTKVNPDGDLTVSGLGVAMTQYCAACHTDYLAKSGTATGTFNYAYRHTTDSDSYTCVRCHFAHGTESDIMKDAEGHTLADLVAAGWTEAEARAYLVDKNPSSALKRFTNMSVCWACHTDSKATQLKNNEFYQNGGNGEVPHGLPDGN